MHVLLGRVAGQRGDDGEAIRHLERAVELRPQEDEWRFALARLLIAVGRGGARAELICCVWSRRARSTPRPGARWGSASSSAGIEPPRLAPSSARTKRLNEARVDEAERHGRGNGMTLITSAGVIPSVDADSMTARRSRTQPTVTRSQG